MSTQVEGQKLVGEVTYYGGELSGVVINGEIDIWLRTRLANSQYEERFS